MEEPSMDTDQPDHAPDSPASVSDDNSRGESVDGLEKEKADDDYLMPGLYTSKTLLELSNSSWSRSAEAYNRVQPYLRGCKWSPDGTCCLSVVNNDGVHITELPRDLYSGCVHSDRFVDVLGSVIHVPEAGLVYDFCWYPKMNTALPVTCCWLTTRQNGPIHLWDAYDGALRCSYRGYNTVDEVESALSVAFNTEGSRIIAGYKKTIKTFDTERPGRFYEERVITSSASCLAVENNLLAVGSWNKTISLYNVSEMGTYKSIGKMTGHDGGLTHMKFTPDGQQLVSGARKDPKILIWDMRNYKRPVNTLTRANTTSQRIYFDISSCGRYLVAGGTDGLVSVWDAESGDWKNSVLVMDPPNKAAYKYPLHSDCCNSVSIHPFRPILATGSGQVHYEDPSRDSSPEKSDSDEDKAKAFCSSANGDESWRWVSTLKDNSVAGNGTKKDNTSNGTKEDNGAKDTEDVAQGKDLEVVPSLFDMRYSKRTENTLVFWWTAQVPQ